ncbi:MAG: hypothetical protein ACYDAK_06165 [Candidatus Limnocylindrales bacterium]
MSWSSPSHAAHRSASWPAALTIVAVLLAGCSVAGDPSPAPGSPSIGSGTSPDRGSNGPTIAHRRGAADLVIRIELEGGFVPPQVLMNRYPSISIYGDGSVITEGPVAMIYPGPALPNLQVTRISEAGLQTLLALAATDGLLGPDARYDATGIADAATTAFTVVADGVRHRITAYALGEAPEDTNLDPATAAARAKLRAFQAAASDLRATVGAALSGSGGPYAYAAIRLYVTPGRPSVGDAGLARPSIAWPLATPLAAFGKATPGTLAGTRCGVVLGGDLATLRPLLEGATQISGWTSGGATYTVIPHPMLPDETGCPVAA